MTPEERKQAETDFVRRLAMLPPSLLEHQDCLLLIGDSPEAQTFVWEKALNDAGTPPKPASDTDIMILSALDAKGILAFNKLRSGSTRVMLAADLPAD